MLKNVLKFYAKAAELLADERGDLKTLVAIVGFGVVMALIIIGAMTYAPQTAQSFWQAATDWIRRGFGI
jgi:hypothetical protein